MRRIIGALMAVVLLAFSACSPAVATAAQHTRSTPLEQPPSRSIEPVQESQPQAPSEGLGGRRQAPCRI